MKEDYSNQEDQSKLCSGKIIQRKTQTFYYGLLKM